MHKHIATKWTAALRSGDYSQTKEVLHKDASFCCLGVLCDLHRTEVGGEWVNGSSEMPAGCQVYSTGDDWDYSLLPDPVRLWAGLANCGGTIRDGSLRCLTVLNDDGWTFQQIADLIDKGWEAL